MNANPVIPLVCALLAGFSGTVAANHCPRFLSAPEPVRKTVIAEARGGFVEEMEVHRIEGKTIYIAEIETPAELKIYVEEGGALRKVREEITAAGLPEAVRKVIDAENGRIDDLEKQTSGGKVVYHAEIDTPGGGEVNLRIAPDGTVISRKEKLAD